MNRTTKKHKELVLGIFVFLFITTLFLSTTPVYANPGDTCPLPSGGSGYIQQDNQTCCPSPSSNADNCLFGKYINPVIQLLSAIVGVVVVIAIIIGGIEFSSSAGDPQKAAMGRKHITNALIGLVAYLLLYTFLRFILSPTGGL